MDSTLIDSLKSIHDASLQWEQDPVVMHDGIQVQLCHVIGKKMPPRHPMHQISLIPPPQTATISSTKNNTKAQTLLQLWNS